MIGMHSRGNMRHCKELVVFRKLGFQTKFRLRLDFRQNNMKYFNLNPVHLTCNLMRVLVSGLQNQNSPQHRENFVF